MKDPRQDARKLHPIAQEALRLRAVQQVVEHNQSPEQVARSVGIHHATMGERPILPNTGRRYRLNLLSAITPQGKLRFMSTDETVNAKLYCTFLSRRLQDAD